MSYHWSELWRTLLSLLKFLTSYASDIRSLPKHETLLDSLVNLIALSLSAGDAFLASPADYDDLFYKLVETGETLTKFRDAYSLASRPTSSIATLIAVSAHYAELLASQPGTARVKTLSPRMVSKVIKSGYDTLAISARDDLDAWERFREADEKSLLKKVARLAVADVRSLLGGV
ncbi:MAG: hypothetical protein M1825_001179 [Sarcosagium campestre]|nr:MAG: hypothetical protein M1825_001179 [Sarcosagium campestre]